MGSYNNTSATLICPRCKVVVDCSIDLYFGDTSQMVTIPIGSPYPFRLGRAPQNGGPFLPENPRGMGYAECPSCNRDFHCVAEVHDGILVSVVPNPDLPPFDPDREQTQLIACPECGSTNTSAQYFTGFTVGRLVCHSKPCSCIGLFSHDQDGNPVQVAYNPTIRPICNR